MKSEVSSSLLAGRYRLRAVLGRGGMGVIWLGTDELLLRDVAIKEVSWPPLLDEAERAKLCERALREARTAARLSHPNVVGVYDVVEQDARPWIVMQYLPYPSLREVVAGAGPLDPPRAARVGLGVLAALRAAHAAGVLHRDVKPGNVLLGPAGQVVLTDFGIAVADGSSALTTSGAIVGSPSYLAPERARGEQATPAADLWSLGATIYDAVEGRPPFDRDGTLAVLTAVVTDPPDPPARAGALWPVLSGLLAKDPAARTGPAEAERELAGVAAAEAAANLRATERMTALLGPGPMAGAEPASPDPADPQPARAEPPRRDPALPARPGQPAAPPTLRRPGGDAPALPPAPPEPAARTVGRDPAPRRRRPLMLAALAAVVAIVAAGIGLALTGQRTPHAASPPRTVRPGGGHRGTGRAHASAGRHPATRVPHSAQAGPGSAAGGGTAPAAGGGSGRGGSAGTGGATVPAGFHRYTDPTGFSIGVPDGWAVTHSGQLVYVQGPGAPFLIVDQTTHPRPSALADWQQQESVRRYTYPHYHLIRLVPIAYPQAQQAADWEFTYLNNGALLHVVNRNILVNSGRAYALYWSAPQSQWNSVFPIFQTIAATFSPAGPGKGS